MKNLKLKSKIKIYRNGILEKEYSNLYTYIGLNTVAFILCGFSYDYLYGISIGTGTTTVTSDDTAIENPILTKQFTNVDILGNEIIFTIYLELPEALGTWGNLGIITNDGILFSHLNVNFTKTNNDLVMITYTISLNTED